MKRKVWSILLTLCMVMAMMPAAAFAEGGGSASVSTEKELNAALKDGSVSEIRVTGNLTYTDSLDASKTVVIDNGVTLTIGGYQTTVSGTIVNNGTIKVTSSYECIWTAKTTGTGNLVAANQNWGEYQTYVDYGCVPDAMLNGSNCRINIVKDVTVQPTVSLSSGKQVGDTITPEVTNLIDGVDLEKVFKYTWKDGSSNQVYNGAASPTLTKKGKLSLNLAAKKPYVMRSPSGSYGSMDAATTIASKTYDTIYVDYTGGNNSNEGISANTAVKTLATAMEKVSAGGTIVLCGDYNSSYELIEKSITIKSNTNSTATLSLTSSDGLKIKDGANVTLESIAIKDTTIMGYGGTAGKSLTLKNCTGSATVANNNYAIDQVTLDGCELSGDIYAKDTLQLISSQLNGKFTTKDFAAKGACSITVKKNTPCVVTGTITAESPVTLTPANLQRAEHLIEVPSGTADAVAAKFQLKDTKDDLYALKCRTQYNGTYIEVSKRIDSASGKIAVAYEPIIQGNVMDSKSSDEHEYTDRDFADDLHNLIIKSSTWSGYTNKTDKTWSLGDKPELTIVLSTDIRHNNDSHFDKDFSVDDLKIYSWTGYEDNQGASYSDDAQNQKVKLVVKDGQGVSDDGRTFTFTIQYPEVTRLDQTIKMDTSDRTATCGKELDAREATAKTTLSYESSDPEIASVDPATGKITAHKAGEVTITVKAAQSDLYNAAESHYKLTVNHKFGNTWSHDENNHWKDCVCGAKGEEAHHSGGEATCTKTAECNICGTKYGNTDPNNHSSLKHVEATAATQDKEGNIEYWYCEDCGRYFRDEAAKEEINKEDTITAKLPPSSDNNQKPGDSSQNDQKGQKPDNANTDNGAKTGDAMPIGLLAVLMLAAGAGIAFCGRKLHKSR